MKCMDDYLDAVEVYNETVERMGEDRPQTQLALAKVMALGPNRHWGTVSIEEQKHE